jgi:hypothetical protein
MKTLHDVMNGDPDSVYCGKIISDHLGKKALGAFDLAASKPPQQPWYV